MSRLLMLPNGIKAARNSSVVASVLRPPTWMALLEARIVGSDATEDAMFQYTPIYLHICSQLERCEMNTGNDLFVNQNNGD